MNDQLARAAESAAVILSDHKLPDVACVEITRRRAADTTRTVFQLSASTAELGDLVAATESLSGDVVATVLRRVRPCAFTHVQVDGFAADIPVSVWTQPGERELSVLWSAVGHIPEINVRARVDLDTLRAAADSSTSDSAA